MEEIWKDVVGYENLYQVSNLGRIKSLEKYDGRGWHRKEKFKKIHKNKGGYLVVELVKNKIKNKYLVHRLVAQAFIPNPENYPCVNHKNETRNDNRVENLEWCTQKYNCNYGNAQKKRIEHTDFKKRKVNPITAEKNSRKTAMYSLDNKLIRVFKSREEAKKYGFEPSCISECVNGKLKTHKGYIWKNA